MNPKLKAVLAVLAGILAGGLVIGLAEMVSPYEPPVGTNINDAEKIGEWIKTLPASAFMFLLLSYFLGAAVGGWVANRLASTTHYRPALLVGFGLFVAGLLNVLAIPHPLWFSLVSSVIYFAGAWIGGRSVRRPRI